MKRFIEKELQRWKESPRRLPLLVRGARQVGKSYSIETFGKESFASVVVINFELNPEYKNCFNTLDPRAIVEKLELLTNSRIIPGQTLLFLDEIQECPQAIAAFRYFKEQLPELHVIGAGSLLEFILNDANFSFPVGRIQFLYLRPLSFQEYLRALGQEQLSELSRISLQKPPAKVIHDHYLKFVRSYFFIGGMPAVVKVYKDEKSLLACREVLLALLAAYRNDFGKYASRTQYKYLQQFYEKAPTLVGKHFQYKKIDPDSRSRELKIALEQLCHAGLLQQVFATAADGLPLMASINERKFKLLFLDIGLLERALEVDVGLLEKEDLVQIKEGALAEQFVGQELLALADCYEEKKLFFWEREKKGSEAEVDYLFATSGQIFPIEVKAGNGGSLKSLHQFMKEKKSSLGIKISKEPLSFKGNILSVPFYLMGELPRLIQEALAIKI